MTSTQNTAAWLPGVGKLLEVRPAETPFPAKGDLLVEVSERLPNFPKYGACKIWMINVLGLSSTLLELYA
jgi:hypothetical protein